MSKSRRVKNEIKQLKGEVVALKFEISELVNTVKDFNTRQIALWLHTADAKKEMAQMMKDFPLIEWEDQTNGE